MANKEFYDNTGRITIVAGHYGSGKTEFAVSLSLLLASERPSNRAIIDLDIVNPYFRSREQRALLERSGISVYGSAYGEEVTVETPSLDSGIRAPLEDKSCKVIIDAGGNDSGALVLNQFSKYFDGDSATMLIVLNANRPETRDIEGALLHIAAIEAVTGMAAFGIVNNCHMLRETTAETIMRGHELCVSVCSKTGKELWCDCYPEGLVDPVELGALSGRLLKLGLYMRPTWLDK